MDETDLKALRHLMQDGRTTWSDLASILSLSAPAASERVRKLEERGVIKGYTAIIDPETVGLGLTTFMAVTLEKPEHRQAFLQLVQELPQIQECHHVAGEDDYLLKVRCTGTRELEHILSDKLKILPGVARTRTMIVLSSVKETCKVALPSSEQPGG